MQTRLDVVETESVESFPGSRRARAPIHEQVREGNAPGAPMNPGAHGAPSVPCDPPRITQEEQRDSAGPRFTIVSEEMGKVTPSATSRFGRFV